MAIGCAIAMVSQSNPLYSAISLIGVFISLASIYVTLAAPFIAAVQVIVYAGAIMVLVIFVIMLLNVEHSEPRRKRLKFLVPMAIGMAAILLAETAFILYSVQTTENQLAGNISDVGLTHSIGEGLFTRYLLPFELTSVLLLMAIVGAMSLARRTTILSATARVVPGAQVLAMDIANPRRVVKICDWSRLKQLKRRPIYWASIFIQTAASRSRNYGSATFLVSGALGRPVHDWRGRRNHQAQRDRDVHVHRVDAQRREPDVSWRFRVSFRTLPDSFLFSS